MTYETNKTAIEKISIMTKAYNKADKDLVLYWHYQSVKDETREEIKETR